MAADILLFNAQKVPVGRDQIQHIEMARDFGQRFNHLYGVAGGREFFVLPEAHIEEQVATLPGLDGRKMSKSYDNTIPLFAPREQLRKLIAGIVTDSRAPGEAKEAEGSHVFQLYQAFSTEAEAAAMRQAFADGIGWGDAKQALFERIDAEIAPQRDKYEALMARPADIEDILRDGARRLRAQYATPLMAELREAVGLRNLAAVPVTTAKAVEKASLPVIKQYREADGRFYFKLADGDRVLLQSIGFASPREAGELIGALKAGTLSVSALDAQAALGDGVAVDEAQAALDAIVQAAKDKEAAKA
jgi:tryptophanyl-tRNA synthetase